jgi:acetyl-CoA acetyltransferase
MTTRNSIKDQVAIVGYGTTPYLRNAGKSRTALALDACRAAMTDAGLGVGDIDGIAGTLGGPSPAAVQGALGIPATTWWAHVPVTFQIPVVQAINAVYAGACETALVYHTTYRAPGASRSAAGDPLRMRAFRGAGAGADTDPAAIMNTAAPYASWAARYLYEYGAKREHFGLVAINNRTNAGLNDHAALREPITMDDYLAARMVRTPLGVLDMDFPIDSADALVVTTLERARDLTDTPVVVHASATGTTCFRDDGQLEDLAHSSQRVSMDGLWARSDLKLDDIDIYFPYDGFTFLTLCWMESAGFCGRGEAGPFIEDNWDASQHRIAIGPKQVRVNTHGGSLSDGGTQGAGHIREAVIQLRGEGGARQAPNVGCALVTPGGLFFNAGAMILRTE